MEFEKLAELIFSKIKPKLENNQGLSIFAKERAKFEGWLNTIHKYLGHCNPIR